MPVDTRLSKQVLFVKIQSPKVFFFSFFIFCIYIITKFLLKINYGVKDGVRSRNLWIHIPVLYQLRYQHHIMVESSGVEPECLDFQSSAPTVYANFPYSEWEPRFLSRDTPFTSYTTLVDRQSSISLLTLSDLHGTFFIAFRTTWKGIFLNTRGIFCSPLPWVCFLLF